MWRYLLLGFLTGCPGADEPDLTDDTSPVTGEGEGEGALAVTVTVSADAREAEPLESVQFTASVENASSNAVTWALSSGPGEVDSAGLYTADEDVGTAVIAACSVEDASACGSAEITVARGGTLQRSKRVDHSYEDDLDDIVATEDGIIAVGETYEDQTSAHNYRAWVVPWTWSGGVDTALGGAQWFDFNNGGCEAYAAAVDADGKVVVTGDYGYGGTAFLLRLKTNGDADPSFGDGGELEIGTGTYGEIGVDADGGYVLGTKTQLLRTTADGDLDSGYGDGGVINLALPPDDASAYGEVQLLDLKVSGETTVLLAHAGEALVYGRFDRNGQPDAGVSATGLSVATVLTDDDMGALNGFSLDADGRMMVAWGDPDNGKLELYAILPDGTLDADFGRRGVATASFDAPDSIGDFNFDACCTAVDDQGRVVVAGSEGPHLLVTRFTAEGDLDPAWGDDQNLYAEQVGSITVIGAAVGPTGGIAVVAVVDDSGEPDDDAMLYLFNP